jgi:hypothetical protein
LLTNGRPLSQNSGVSSPWNPLVDEWGRRPRGVPMTNRVLSRGHARRMSRSFAGVGVAILPARLRQIAAGGACANGELAAVQFALIATEIQREQRHAKFERGRRRCVRWLLFAGLVIAALNSLISLAYVLFSVIEQSSPY